MPSAIPLEPSDMASAAPAFSYAQAAKGRSPSQSVAPSVTKTTSDLPETSQKAEHSNGVVASDSISMPTDQEVSMKPEQITEPAVSTQETDTLLEVHESLSKQSEPVNGTNGNAHQEFLVSEDFTVHKQEDSATALVDTDNHWDKASQPSHGDEKDSSKVDSNDDDSKTDSWEEPPPPAQLKEAPPPAFNVWQKRAADAQNKARDVRSTPKDDSGFVAGHRNVSNGLDSLKTDSKKKSSTRRLLADDRVGSGIDTKEDKSHNRNTKSPGSKSFAAPPPPSDAISWPTPDLSKEEEKKKNQEKADKPDTEKTPSKHHGKEKWVQMAYVPTAVFNTPLPTTSRRGGRPRGGREGGGRGGHSINGSVSGERTPSGSVAPSTNNSDRFRGDMGPPKSSSLPPKAKRASSAGPSSSREQRRNGDSHEDGTQKHFSRNAAADNRRVSSSTQTDTSTRQGSPPNKRQDSNRDERSSSVFSGRREGGGRQEFGRDSGPIPNRERGEGRSDRGRGGFRGGRGGHNGFGGHSTNGQASTSGFTAGSGPAFPQKSQSVSEQRFASQPQTPSFGPQRDPKHFRSNSRSQSIPNPSSFGRYPSGGTGPQGLPQLQTDTANMFYAPPAVMSAVPYSVLEQVQLSSMIQMQMEYYFSLDNLVKDTFLRKHMDSQGFVLLRVLLNFNRIRQLSTDIELVRAACWRSHVIEFQTGNDGQDRVRVSRDWHQWVLPLQERDLAAQNDGPTQLFPPNLPYGPNGVPTPMMSPGSFGPPPYRSDQGPINGSSTGQGNDGSGSQTALSAAVPDFTPMTSMAPPQSFQPAVPLPENVFPDEQVDSLTVVYKREQADVPTTKSSAPSGRTFSNGSLDPNAISDELSQLGLTEHPGATNGDLALESRSQDSLARSRSPASPRSAARQSSGNVPPPVFWAKGNDSTLGSLPPSLIAEPYSSFRHSTLSQRENSAFEQPSHAMTVLYQFWSHFLIRHFNYNMYEEFKRLALEDDKSGRSSIGLENLITFYDVSLLGKDPISDLVAQDYVELAKQDLFASRKERPAFQKLRASWRNGALPLLERVKIFKLMEPELKSELDR